MKFLFTMVAFTCASISYSYAALDCPSKIHVVAKNFNSVDPTNKKK